MYQHFLVNELLYIILLKFFSHNIRNYISIFSNSYFKIALLTYNDKKFSPLNILLWNRPNIKIYLKYIECFITTSLCKLKYI